MGNYASSSNGPIEPSLPAEAWQKIFNSHPDAILIIDAEGLVLAENEEAQRLFDDKSLVGQEWGRSLDSREPVEIELRQSDGSMRTAEMRASATEIDGSPVTIVSLRDVSHSRELRETLHRQQGELRSLLQQLAAAQQAERHRIGRLLHDELQHLLVAVRIHLSEQSDLETASELLREAQNVAHDLSARLSPPRLGIDLCGSLQSMFRDMQQRFGLTVDANLQPAVDAIVHDDQLVVYDIVRELLFNVVKHSGQRTAGVSLQMAPTNLLRLEVSDPGQGFTSLKDLDRPSDVGIGLRSIRQRLLAAGGGVVIESKHREGCRIRLTIPVELSDLPAASVQQQVDAEGGADRETAASSAVPATLPSGEELLVKVLVVDDHDGTRELTSRMIMKSKGLLLVGAAADGAEGLRLIQELQPDAVLLDYNLPDMSGEVLARQISTLPVPPTVFGFTAHQSPEVHDSMRRAGARDVIVLGGPFSEVANLLRQVSIGD